MIRLISRVLSVAGTYATRIKIAFACSFFKSMLSKMPILLAFLALREFSAGAMTNRLCVFLGLAMIAGLVLQVVFQNVADRLQSAAGFMIFSDMRMQLGQHLRRMPMGYFTEGNIGKISSVLSTDMVFIEENCMTVIADMMSYIFAEAVLIAFLLYFNVWLGLAAIGLALVAMLVAKGMEKEALADSANRQNQSENLTEAVLDFTEGIGIIKTCNLLGEKSKELADNFRKSCDVSLTFERNHTPWQRGLNLIYGAGAVVILALSLFLHTRSMLDTPYLIGVSLFVFDIFGPLKALYGNSTRLTVMNSCMDRIEEVFAEAELPDAGQETIPPQSETTGPEVAFEKVRFAYGETDVLHDISFALPGNAMLALVGPSGGGKSTIASLLTRFWDVRDGRVLVRGKDVRNVPLADLMDHISMVFQRVYLFQDTVYNNISMGRPDATETEVMEAARKARCYDFIMNLPEGFQTVVGEGGATLSGGEKQRISIARCMLKDAPIVILDEATASVDADNENYIQEAISELCRGKTLLVIAHRLNTIRNADQILVVADGQIRQSGTHDELIAEDGIYRAFVTARENACSWNRLAAGS